jgi:hypothetical protein
MAPMVINGRTVDSRVRVGEVLNQVSPDLIRQAYDEGYTFSAFLEHQDPTAEYENDPVLRGLDAFERLLYVAGLQTRSMPGAGRWASTIQDFEKREETRLLIPELMSRFWRSASYGSANTRAIFSSADDLPGQLIRPWADAAEPRWDRRLGPPVRLAELVAVTTPIGTDAYRAFYLSDVAAEQRMVRVSEMGEIPAAKITGGEHTIRLLKYGRRIDQSYEALRRQRLDKVRLWVQRLAIRTEMEKVAHALQTLVNGDGNAGTSATNVQIKTDLDSAATGFTLTLKAWLAFRLKWFPTYRLSHILGAEADVLKLLLLNIGSSGASVPTYLGDVTAEPATCRRSATAPATA